MFFFLKYEMPDWMSSGTCLFVLDITGAALQCPTTRDVISLCVCAYMYALPPFETNPPNVKADVG